MMGRLPSKIAALAELNKMFGYYAPTKIAATDKDGENLPKPDYSNFTVEELNTYIALEKKAGL